MLTFDWTLSHPQITPVLHLHATWLCYFSERWHLVPESFSFPLTSDMQRSCPCPKLYTSILEGSWKTKLAAVWKKMQVTRGGKKRRAGTAGSACCIFAFCYFPSHPLGCLVGRCELEKAAGGAK